MKTGLTREQAFAVPNAVERIFNGATWTVYEPGDQLPPRPAEGLPEVDMAQLRAALIEADQLAAFDAAVASLIAGLANAKQKARAQNWASHVRRVNRSHPLVAQIGAAMGMTPAQIDNLFRAADAITP
jgi:hypothetical protein